MYFKFESLLLQTRKERILIDLSHQISFFHGQIGSGKSSLVRLIDFMLGGNLEFTPAIKQELIASTLNLNIGANSVVLERQVDSTNIRVTWSNQNKESATVLAPKSPTEKPIWNENIFNFNDLIFFLLGMSPPTALKSKIQEETSMIRVSLRDFMWYCYLDQDHLDSSFYRLEDTFKRNKSKDVMRYVVGYHSEKLSQLQRDRINAREERINAISNIKNLNNLLEKFEFESADEIEDMINSDKENLLNLKLSRNKLEKNYQSETHVVDKYRNNARRNIKNVENSLNAIDDLNIRISQQTSLRNELLSSKFKLARSISIASVLDNVKFDLCPSCGSNIENHKVNKETCYLCHSDIENSKNIGVESLKLDIDSRIEELENSIDVHKKELVRQKRLLKKQQNFKANIDKKIDEELANYDSRFLSLFRNIDRKIATLEERVKGNERLRKIPIEIEAVESKIIRLERLEEKIKENILKEESKLLKARGVVVELEIQFKQTLLEIGFPGVKEKDLVRIDKTSWNVYVFPDGKEDRKWSFENAGSGGKKTLFNVAYLLSLHLVASNNNLPLPNFIIIDTPMKNINEEINSEIFDKFYKFLYDAAKDELKNTQFIIVDKDFVLPEFEIDLYNRFMTPDDPDNPPLIPYYQGP